MYGDSISSFIGNLTTFDSVKDMHSLFFQTVFVATAATIVSGAIAERTKFSPTHLSLMMTVFIYPISGHWVWQGDGWLTKLGFIDFAGFQLLYTCWRLGFIGSYNGRSPIGKYTNGLSNLFQVT
jgi:Amt family ammonium transporter